MAFTPEGSLHRAHNQPYLLHQSVHDEDEIDLFELVEKLWARRLTIVAVAAIISLVAVVATLFWPPTWQSTVRIYYASSLDLAPLQKLQSETGVPVTSPADAYTIYYAHLASPATHRAVFERSRLPIKITEKTKGDSDDAAVDDAFWAFSKSLNVEKAVANQPIKRGSNKKYGGNYITATFESKDKEFSASLINDFLLPTAHERTIKEIKEKLSVEVGLKKDETRREVAQVESRFLVKKEEEKQHLERAFEIAKADGVTSLTANNFFNGTTLLNGMSPELYFLLGTKIIEEMIERNDADMKAFRLISRPKDNDQSKPLLPQVASLDIKLQRLSNLEKDFDSLDNLEVVAIEEPARVPTRPIKPNKKLIIALGVVLGCMLGIFVALIQMSIASRKEKLEKQREQVDGYSPPLATTPEPEADILSR